MRPLVIDVRLGCVHVSAVVLPPTFLHEGLIEHQFAILFGTDTFRSGVAGPEGALSEQGSWFSPARCEDHRVRARGQGPVSE